MAFKFFLTLLDLRDLNNIPHSESGPNPNVTPPEVDG